MCASTWWRVSADVECSLRRVTPMLVQQPDNEVRDRNAVQQVDL